MERVWSGSQFFVTLSGNKPLAKQYVRQARIYAGFLFDGLSGVNTTRFQSWREDDGTMVFVQVWRDVLGDRATARIVAPGYEDEEVTSLPGLVAFIPHSGFIADPFTGQHLQSPRYTYASPYYDENGDELNALLGTAYNTTMVGREGDLRVRKPAECGWLARRSSESGKWSATRGHAGYFGCQNWLGQDGEGGRADKDILSWDGPKSRYATGGMLGYAMYDGRVFHKLRTLVDIMPYSSTNAWNVNATIGAAIRHESNGVIYLYQACSVNNTLQMQVFRWELLASGADSDSDEFSDRYVPIGDPTPLHHTAFRDELPAGGGWIRKTGLYFNASGTRAVCTIGVQSNAAIQHTYLCHYDPESGFSFEKVFDAAEHEKESGELFYPPRYTDDEMHTQVVEVTPTALCPNNRAIQNLITGFEYNAGWSNSKEYIYKTLSVQQIVCAEYVGDSIVYLYCENPESTHTYSLYDSGAASWGFQQCPPFISGTCHHPAWDCTSKIYGTLDAWMVSSYADVVVKDRKFWSSDGQLVWSGGACASYVHMDGNEMHLDKGPIRAYPGLQRQNGLDRYDVRWDRTQPYTMSYVHRWNGWTYTNPARCRGEKSLMDISFLDLRFGLMAIHEERWEESCEVIWKNDFYDTYNKGDIEQFYDLRIAKKITFIDGGTVVDEVVYDEVVDSVPIGVPVMKYGQNGGTGYGTDYWYRMYDYYMTMPSDREAVGSAMYRPYGHTCKAWHEIRVLDAPSDGSGQMLKCGGDLIYTLVYGGSEFLVGNYAVNPQLDAVDMLQQTTYWAGDTTPQMTFCHGPMEGVMFGNIGLI